MIEKLIERLIRYAKIDTQSDFEKDATPSTPGQWDLLAELEKEMKSVGLEEIEVDEHGYLFGTLPSTTTEQRPVIGFLAHVDTATDFTGKGVNPQRIENYDGKDIPLNNKVTMKTADFPALQNYIGHTLITTDGTTLLGADNKAGVAEIMTAMEYLIEHPEIEHGKIRVGFTPDEEIGRGPHKFDVARFGADYRRADQGAQAGCPRRRGRATNHGSRARDAVQRAHQPVPQAGWRERLGRCAGSGCLCRHRGDGDRSLVTRSGFCEFHREQQRTFQRAAGQPAQREITR